MGSPNGNGPGPDPGEEEEMEEGELPPSCPSSQTQTEEDTLEDSDSANNRKDSANNRKEGNSRKRKLNERDGFSSNSPSSDVQEVSPGGTVVSSPDILEIIPIHTVNRQRQRCFHEVKSHLYSRILKEKSQTNANNEEDNDETATVLPSPPSFSNTTIPTSLAIITEIARNSNLPRGNDESAAEFAFAVSYLDKQLLEAIFAKQKMKESSTLVEEGPGPSSCEPANASSPYEPEDEDMWKIIPSPEPECAAAQDAKPQPADSSKTLQRIVDEVKLAIRPFFRCKEITKDEYKHILKRAVSKIFKANSEQINKQSVTELVTAYVTKVVEDRYT